MRIRCRRSPGAQPIKEAVIRIFAWFNLRLGLPAPLLNLYAAPNCRLPMYVFVGFSVFLCVFQLTAAWTQWHNPRVSVGLSLWQPPASALGWLYVSYTTLPTCPAPAGLFLGLGNKTALQTTDAVLPKAKDYGPGRGHKTL